MLLKKNLILKKFSSPLFINSEHDLKDFFRPDKNKFFQTTFYKNQRKKHSILINADGKPSGGKWTFDTENRKKYPRKKHHLTLSCLIQMSIMKRLKLM